MRLLQAKSSSNIVETSSEDSNFVISLALLDFSLICVAPWLLVLNYKITEAINSNFILALMVLNHHNKPNLFIKLNKYWS